MNQYETLLRDIRKNARSIEGGACGANASRIAHALVMCAFLYLYYMNVGGTQQAVAAAQNAVVIIKDFGIANAVRIWDIVVTQSYEFQMQDLAIAGAIPTTYAALEVLLLASNRYTKLHSAICAVLTGVGSAGAYVYQCAIA